MGGFPARPLFADFGQAHLNIAPVVDPERDLDIAHWVLMKHQVAGMGLLVPRVMAKLTVANPTLLLARAEVWNPDQLTTGSYAAPTPAFVSTGRATLTYLSSIPDEEAAAQSIAFSWAYGWKHASPPTTLKWVQVAPVTATPHVLEVCVFNAAGALENGSDVWIVAG